MTPAEMNQSTLELQQALGAMKAQAERIGEEESEALREHYGAHVNKVTPKGRKIHVPVNTLIEISTDQAFIVTHLARKRITIEGFGKPLSIRQKIQLFDGLFIVSSHSTRQDKQGRTRQVHNLSPCEGTKINTTHLRR